MFYFCGIYFTKNVTQYSSNLDIYIKINVFNNLQVKPLSGLMQEEIGDTLYGRKTRQSWEIVALCG